MRNSAARDFLTACTFRLKLKESIHTSSVRCTREPRMRNVLLTCGGHWVGLALQLKEAMGQVPALRDGRLLVADRARIVPAGCYADRAVQVPDISDPSYVDR